MGTPHKVASSPQASRPSTLWPLLTATVLTGAFAWIAATLEPQFVNYQDLDAGSLKDAQTQTLTMVKELNSYLISLTTLIVGGVGWYFSHYRSVLRPVIARVIFFFVVGLIALAAWYAFQTYAEIVGELAQNSVALAPAHSLILWFVTVEATACGIAALLLLGLFADAVTRKPDPEEKVGRV